MLDALSLKRPRAAHSSLQGTLRLFSTRGRAPDEKHGFHVFIPALPPAMTAAELVHAFEPVWAHMADTLVLRGPSNLAALLRCRSQQGAREVRAKQAAILLPCGCVGCSRE